MHQKLKVTLSSYTTKIFCLWILSLRRSSWVLVGKLASTNSVSNTVKDGHSQRIMKENALKEVEMSHHGGENGKKEPVKMLEMCTTYLITIIIILITVNSSSCP